MTLKDYDITTPFVNLATVLESAQCKVTKISLPRKQKKEAKKNGFSGYLITYEIPNNKIIELGATLFESNKYIKIIGANNEI